MGVLLAMIAGIFTSIQGVFNGNVSKVLGSFETVILVHVVGLISAIIVWMIADKGDFTRYTEVNKIYLLGGIMGVMIVFGVMNSINMLGPSVAIAVIVITQLGTSMLIEFLGLFGTEKVAMTFHKPLGLALMVVGLFVMKGK